MASSESVNLRVNGEIITPSKWKLDITNDLQPWAKYPSFPIKMDQLDMNLRVESTLTFDDPEAYERLTKADPPLYTVTVEVDLNPWHRAAFGWRAKLRKARDCAWFEIRRRILRRAVVTTATATYPNCEITRPWNR